MKPAENLTKDGYIIITRPHILMYLELPTILFTSRHWAVQEYDQTIKERETYLAHWRTTMRYKQLKQSIQEVGIQNPVTAKLHNLNYELIDGGGRYYMARELGIQFIPTILNCWEGQDGIPKGVHLKDTCEAEQYFYAGEHSPFKYLPDGCISARAVCCEEFLYDRRWR